MGGSGRPQAPHGRLGAPRRSRGAPRDTPTGCRGHPPAGGRGYDAAQAPTPSAGAAHADEMTAAVAILRREPPARRACPLHGLTLQEPPREQAVLASGRAVERAAFAVLLDNADGRTYEAVVSLTAGAVTSWEHVPGVQPPIASTSSWSARRSSRASPEWQAAVRKRGVTDFDLCMVDPWSNGNYGADEDGQLRLVRALTWVRTSPLDNGYARPIENVITVVDLNAMKVVRVEDGAVVPLPPERRQLHRGGRRRPAHRPEAARDHASRRARASTSTATRCAGRSGGFRVGFNRREGLVLHTRHATTTASASGRSWTGPRSCDMVVPVRRSAARTTTAGTPSTWASTASACCANSLDARLRLPGRDPLLRRRPDRQPAASRSPIPNAICLHEEDAGILWKHIDMAHRATSRCGARGGWSSRSSRRSATTSTASTGTSTRTARIQLEVKLTGIISNGALAAGRRRRTWGSWSRPGVYAPIHQHFFNARLDMTSTARATRSTRSTPSPTRPGPRTRSTNAFHEASRRCCARESEAQRIIDPLSARYWRIANPDVAERAWASRSAYRLVPGENVLPFAAPERQRDRSGRRS